MEESRWLRTGYMMSSFLIFDGEAVPDPGSDIPSDPVDGDDGGSDTVTLVISRKDAEALLSMLDMLAGVIGRG